MKRVFNILLCLLIPTSLFASPRIQSLTVYDQGSITGGTVISQVDSVQDDCNTDPDEEELESFFDTLLGITVLNPLSRDVTFKRFRYRLRYRDGDRTRRLKVKRQGIAGNFIAPGNDTQTEVLVLFLDARNGRKYAPNASEPLPVDSGFTQLRVRLSGRTSDGQRVRIRARATISIGNLDRC